jgi:hypothetical protein
MYCASATKLKKDGEYFAMHIEISMALSLQSPCMACQLFKSPYKTARNFIEVL